MAGLRTGDSEVHERVVDDVRGLVAILSAAVAIPVQRDEGVGAKDAGEGDCEPHGGDEKAAPPRGVKSTRLAWFSPSVDECGAFASLPGMLTGSFLIPHRLNDVGPLDQISTSGRLESTREWPGATASWHFKRFSRI